MRDFGDFAISSMPFKAQKAFHQLYENAMLSGDIDAADQLELLLEYFGRVESKRESDRRTDARRRRTVGARVPVALYERVSACAQERGVSLYRFVVDALERACGDEI